MKKILILSVMFVAMASFISSCCSCNKKSKPLMPFASTEWTLLSLDGTKINPEIAKNFFLTFDETESRFFGKADCNRISGGYEAKENNKLELKAVISTRAMCPNSDIESKFLSMLGNVGSYILDGELMMLYSKEGVMTAVFEGKAPVKTPK